MLSFLAVNALFVAMNVVAAGAIVALGLAAQRFLPWADESLLVWVVIGLIGVALSIVFGAAITGRWQRRGRAGDPA